MLDLGCGLGSDLGYLAERGYFGVGIDLSAVAVGRAASLRPSVRFLQADVTHLPFDMGAFGLVLDRGCFHYPLAAQRSIYAAEAARVLAPGGRLFLRACLHSAGVRNTINESVLRDAFSAWHWLDVSTGSIPSDTRMMPALVALLQRPA